FAVLAGGLALVGLHGVVSYIVTQRTREIGLRMAMGAQPRQVVTMIVGQGLRISLTGIAIGVAASIIIGRVIETLLFGIVPTDPLTYSIIVPTFMLTTALTVYAASSRAAQADPLVALRNE